MAYQSKTLLSLELFSVKTSHVRVKSLVRDWATDLVISS